MLEWCDQARIQDSISLMRKDNQLNLKDEQIANRQLKYVQMEAKFDISQDQIKKERKHKRLYMGTTTAALILLTISLFN